VRHPLETLRVGSYGTENALELAVRKGAKFLFSSTSEVYGDPLVHPQSEDYWGNVNPIGVRGVYDEAKRYAESLVMAYHRYKGVDTRIVRIFNTYGERMRLDDGRVVPNFVCQALRGEPITVYGDGSQTRSFGYVSDLDGGHLATGAHRLPPAHQHRQPRRAHDPGVCAAHQAAHGQRQPDCVSGVFHA
jgi:dTDP-glucose 4,6-dehydratase